MTFTLQVSPTGTTTLPGTEITIFGGPQATSNQVGSQNDPADLYGIVLVIVAIGVALLLSRWLLGRKGPAPR